MEDAMVINKASHDRGFAHGSIIKSQFINLKNPEDYFCRDPSQQNLIDYIDNDGLPYIGRRVKSGEPFYCYYSVDMSKYIVEKIKLQEEYVVENVKQCSDFGAKSARIACITFRISVSIITMYLNQEFPIFKISDCQRKIKVWFEMPVQLAIQCFSQVN